MAFADRISTSGPTSVPIVDLSCFGDGGLEEDQIQVARELHRACVEVGFVYIRGHGCPQDTIDAAFQQVKALFDLNKEQKEALNAKNSSLYRGYNSAETGSHSCTPDEKDTLPDLKESFTIGAEGSLSPMHGANQFPESSLLPHFEPVMRDYWKCLLHVVGRRLMIALAMSLDLPRDFFLQRCSDPVAQMILLRYPPSTPIRRGCGSHTDCGFLTILAQDEDGLQVQNANGTWMMAPLIPGTFVVNLGDMAARWSNDLYQSTLHRVSNNHNAFPRHSIPFFLNCNYDATVECIVSSEEPLPKYPPVKAGEYILEKLGLMYLADTHSMVE